MTRSKNPMLLTVAEVSELLRVHRPKVYELIRDGTLEGFKLGADWRIKRASVENLVGEIPASFFVTKPRGAKILAERWQALKLVISQQTLFLFIQLRNLTEAISEALVS